MKKDDVSIEFDDSVKVIVVENGKTDKISIPGSVAGDWLMEGFSKMLKAQLKKVKKAKVK